MKLYLAQMPGMTRRVWEEMPPPVCQMLAADEIYWRVLISFALFRKFDWWQEQVDSVPGRFEVFADSGAFSAWTQGLDLGVDDYIRWVFENKHHLVGYANLDVRGDLDKTKVHQQAMEAAGLTPVPVFHAGDPFIELERLIERYPYIALGGVAGIKQITHKPLVRWLIQCFKLARGKAVFHGFGITGWRVLKAFPWYSCDSTSWAQGMRYGQIAYFDDEWGKWSGLKLRNGNFYAAGRRLREFGFDPQTYVLYNKSRWGASGALGCFSFMRAEAWLTKRWGPVLIPQSA